MEGRRRGQRDENIEDHMEEFSNGGAGVRRC